MKESGVLISHFSRTIGYMVKNGLPYPWGTNLKLYSTMNYTKIMQSSLCGLILVADKSTIATTNEILNHLKPPIEIAALSKELIQIMEEVDTLLNFELDKYLRILKGVGAYLHMSESICMH